MSKWEMVKLGEVAKTQSGYSFKSDEFQKDGIPIIRIGNLDGESVIVDYDICYYKKFWDEHSEFRIYYGDILIAMSGATVGKIGIYEQNNPALLNQRVGKITPHSDKLYNKYLYSYVKSELFLGKIRAAAFGCAQPNISGKQITDIKIPLPPLEEQKRIADILDKASNLIDLRKQQLEKMDLLIKSKFIDMFGDPVKNPNEWPIMPLMETGSCKNGMNFRANEFGVEIHCLGVGDFKNLSVIEDTQNLPTISLNEMPASEYLLQDDDIVFVRSNGNKALVGRCLATYPGKIPTTYSGFCIRYRKSVDILLTKYLLQVFKAPSMREKIAGRGANIQNLNQQILSQINIPVPPIALQNQFAEVVEQVEKQKVVMHQSLEKMETNYKALMQEYF